MSAACTSQDYGGTADLLTSSRCSHHPPDAPNLHLLLSIRLSNPFTAMRSSSLLTLTVLGAASTLVLAQDADTEPQLDPNAICPQPVIDNVITPCVSQVYTEEAARPGGACSSTDWSCICSLQSGLISCYDLCAGTVPADAVRFNKQACNGQNGVTNVQNGGQLGYTFGTLTTTLAGYTSTTVNPAATTATQSTTSLPSTTVITTVSTPTASSSTSSATQAPSSTAGNTGAAVHGAQLPSRSSFGFSASVAGLVVGAFMVLAA
ncbi:hypothetical protein V8E36_004024 [Tilletia maclaganii]